MSIFSFRSKNKRIEELSDELLKAKRQSSAKDRFFSAMSHEIRTPIHTILGLNELMLRSGELSDEMLEDAGNVESAGKLLLALINDILDLSKLEAGQMDIIEGEYEISALLNDVVGMLWSKAEEKGLRFNVDVAPSIPSRLIGDEIRIKQILINLINNAIKYTREGEVTLHIESEKVEEDRINLVMVVSDTGMGIRKEDIGHLFDAFTRVDEDKNRGIEGTGLGLAIVHQLVESMHGDIRVNSIYMQGSVFTVTLPQGVVDEGSTGNISIHGHKKAAEGDTYVAGFHAPDARILVVDDNRLNAQVEEKLLADTKIKIDLAFSGQEALELTLMYQYDVILLDHQMPGMDGIECLSHIKKQEGGLNKQTPVIALTANTGSDVAKLYRSSGFDSYLAKPVSGMAMEESLMRFLPRHKIVFTGRRDGRGRVISTAKSYRKKAPVAIATSSISDLPEGCAEALGIRIIPFLIHTEGGTFCDTVETVPRELLNYMTTRGKSAKSEPPSVEEYEQFFAAELQDAIHVIFIALGSKAGREFERARAAAQTFENVTVFDSGCLSSGVGILTLVAYQRAQQGMNVEDIIEELTELKKKINCTFVIDTTEFMLRMGNVSKTVHQLANALMVHPALQMGEKGLSVGGVWTGSRMQAWRNYLKYTISHARRANKDFVFVTHVGLGTGDLEWIEQEIRSRSDFKHIIFTKASATISLNCGPGTFGLLFINNASEEYSLSSLIMRSDDEQGTELVLPEEAVEIKQEEKEPALLDEAAGIKSCGSPAGYERAVKLYAGEEKNKEDELDFLFDSGDFENYTIKVHALKSSAKIIGALRLADLSYALEMAGKEQRFEFIKENHAALKEELRLAREAIAEKYDLSAEEDNKKRPLADEFIIEGAIEAIRDAAEEMESRELAAAFAEIEEYSFPPEYEELFAKLRRAADAFDYDAITEIIDKR